jgi:hypothetical protein
MKRRFDVVSKEMHSKLPQAGKIRIRWQSHWFRGLKHNLSTAWRLKTTRYLNSSIYMETRGANYAEVWIGPINIMWPMRWLEGSARQLHPRILNSVSVNTSQQAETGNPASLKAENRN